MRANIFGTRAQSEQRVADSFNSPQLQYRSKDVNFAMSQERFLNEKKARDMLKTFMNRYGLGGIKF
jgi:hypothetical protein